MWVPPIAEQEHIVGECDVLRGETRCIESIYQRKLTALDELKRSLLQQAFNGQM